MALSLWFAMKLTVLLSLGEKRFPQPSAQFRRRAFAVPNHDNNMAEARCLTNQAFDEVRQAIKFDRLCRATRLWYGTAFKRRKSVCRAKQKFINYIRVKSSGSSSKKWTKS